MGKNTSYKSMLRDRCPETVNIALKWCKAKTCWVNHVYDNFINILADKDERYTVTRTILGLSKNGRKFNFHKTIDWDNLTQKETEAWTDIENWVIWFQNTYVFIETSYNNFLKHSDYPEQEDYIIQHYLENYDLDTAKCLTKFIINALENN